MRNIFFIHLFISLLCAVDGTIVFFDGTSIQGEIYTVDQSSVYIIPVGLDFPEEIFMDNIDTLKLDDGKILVAGNEVLLLFKNGTFVSPVEEKQLKILSLKVMILLHSLIH